MLDRQDVMKLKTQGVTHGVLRMFPVLHHFVQDHLHDSPRVALRFLASSRVLWTTPEIKLKLDALVLNELHLSRLTANRQHFLVDICLNLTHLGSIPHLVGIDIRSIDLSFSGVDDIAPLAACRKLRNLNLHGCEDIADISPLAMCTSLEVLDLGYLYKLKDVNALSHCRSLHTLVAEECLSLKTISALRENVKLHTLNLHHCQDVDDFFVCAGVQTLDLSSTNVADLSQLAQFNFLEDLSLNCCENIVDVRPLAMCKNLRVVSLAGCSQLNNVKPLRACTLLETLDLSDTDVYDHSVLTSCPRLQTVHPPNSGRYVDPNEHTI